MSEEEKLAKSEEEKLMEEEEDEADQIKGKCCRVSTLTCCVLYFFLSCRDSLTIFLVPFFTSLGLSVAESGCLYSVQTFSIFFSKVWVWMTTKSGWRKTCFLGLCVGCIVTVYLIPMVAQKQEQDCSSFTGSLFINMLLLMLANAIFFTPIKGVVDLFVLQIVKVKKREASIGKLRIFCSIGLGLSCYFSGLFTDIYGHHFETVGTKALNESSKYTKILSKYTKAPSKYTAVFLTNIPFYLFTIIAGILAESKGKWELNDDEPVKFVKKRQKGVCRICNELPESAGAIIRKRGNMALLMSAFVVGMACGARHTFLFHFLQDKMHSTAAQMGLSYIFLGIGQVFGYLIADQVIDCVGRPLILFEVAILGYFPSYLLLNTLKFNVICFTQLLVGVCTAFFWIGCIGQAKELNEERSYEPLFIYFNWVFNCMGGFIASLLGGGIYETYGASVLFEVIGYFSGIWMVLVTCFFHILYPILLRRKTPVDEESSLTN